MILLFAKHGNHYHNRDFRSDADVKRAFARNDVNYEKLVIECCDFQKHVPFFENLIGSTAYSIGGSSLARVDKETGATDLNTQGPGTIVLYAYWARFEAAINALDRAVAKSSYTDFQSAIVEGIASIEGYIQYKAEYWNKHHPQQVLLDSANNKVRFDDKITQWIPIMTAGRRLDKSTIEWNHFVMLRTIRDDLAIHPKSSSYSTSYAKLAEQINLFRTGIAQLLVNLHLLFGDMIPAKIIRAAYAPDVVFVPSDEQT
jgi:hypothetical protein